MLYLHFGLVQTGLGTFHFLDYGEMAPLFILDALLDGLDAFQFVLDTGLESLNEVLLLDTAPNTNDLLLLLLDTVLYALQQLLLPVG